ncbi:hypothetical protein vBPaerPsIn_127 [Pseudomonas phage vB_Paer_PsIn]|uniref:Uncharacterized protein n=1 Tax=Pseudomonas phage vB_Paer_PsIn TaxID=2924907 RepID=A0A9Y1CFA3_9CAUD|nr:hypothetical protein QE348_gp127 [Pseudomonas phage vB_Paer_PsIn]UOL48155.1 hypothetical protein vBPaerPsIn_127 [Pseudomonas phage vB_Paer_PsIn]
MATLIIGNVNCHNHRLVDEIAGDAGYKGAARLVDECTRKITLLAPSGISAIDAKERAEVAAMIGEYLLAGFEVSIQH